MRLLALEIWRRSTDPVTRAALAPAARWQHEAEALLRERPGCLTATYEPSTLELRLRRQIDARNRQIDARNRARPQQKKQPPIPGLIPWLCATGEEAADLSARQRIEGYLARAAELIEADEIAWLAVEEAEAQASRDAPDRLTRRAERARDLRRLYV